MPSTPSLLLTTTGHHFPPPARCTQVRGPSGGRTGSAFDPPVQEQHGQDQPPFGKQGAGFRWASVGLRGVHRVHREEHDPPRAQQQRYSHDEGGRHLHPGRGSMHATRSLEPLIGLNALFIAVGWANMRGL